MRFRERLGHASVEKPKGPLLWCHAASVGEALSVLSLLETVDRVFKDWRILVTSGTTTSAAVLAARLPKNIVHQYVPIDRWACVNRFCDHWRPDLAFWVESELWPNMLCVLKKRGVPVVLLNGRMSAKSFARWRLLRPWARSLLEAFSLICAQTQEDAGRFASLGGSNVVCAGNLKYAADPLMCDVKKTHDLKETISGRPVWLAASTHQGEDEIALDVHARIQARWPNLLTIIVPRHAARGGQILEIVQKRGLTGARRAIQEPITPLTQIYVADTMGEMGLFYRLAPLTFLAGSFFWGGHNPIEPAQLGCAMLFGPKMTNFAQMSQDFLERKAAVQVRDVKELVQEVERLLGEPRAMLALATAARELVAEKRGVLDAVLRLVTPLLESGGRAAHESP